MTTGLHINLFVNTPLSNLAATWPCRKKVPSSSFSEITAPFSARPRIGGGTRVADQKGFSFFKTQTSIYIYLQGYVLANRKDLPQKSTFIFIFRAIRTQIMVAVQVGSFPPWKSGASNSETFGLRLNPLPHTIAAVCRHFCGISVKRRIIALYW